MSVPLRPIGLSMIALLLAGCTASRPVQSHVSGDEDARRLHWGEVEPGVIVRLQLDSASVYAGQVVAIDDAEIELLVPPSRDAGALDADASMRFPRAAVVALHRADDQTKTHERIEYAAWTTMALTVWLVVLRQLTL